MGVKKETLRKIVFSAADTRGQKDFFDGVGGFLLLGKLLSASFAETSFPATALRAACAVAFMGVPVCIYKCRVAEFWQVWAE